MNTATIPTAAHSVTTNYTIDPVDTFVIFPLVEAEEVIRYIAAVRLSDRDGDHAGFAVVAYGPNSESAAVVSGLLFTDAPDAISFATDRAGW